MDLEVYMKEDRKWFDQGYFVSGELAAASGKNWGEYYSVCKIELFAEEKEEEDCDVNCGLSSLLFERRRAQVC